MTIEDILLSLGSLSKSDLKKILAQTQFLLRGSKVSQPKSFVEEVVHLYAQKWTQVPPKHIIDKKETGSKLSDASREIEELAKELGFGRKDTIKFCQILIEAAVYRLREIPLPVSFNTIVYQLTNPRELLEQSFPGYASNKSGMWRRFILNVG